RSLRRAGAVRWALCLAEYEARASRWRRTAGDRRASRPPAAAPPLLADSCLAEGRGAAPAERRKIICADGTHWRVAVSVGCVWAIAEKVGRARPHRRAPLDEFDPGPVVSRAEVAMGDDESEDGVQAGLGLADADLA